MRVDLEGTNASHSGVSSRFGRLIVEVIALEQEALPDMVRATMKPLHHSPPYMRCHGSYTCHVLLCVGENLGPLGWATMALWCRGLLGDVELTVG